VLRKERTLLHLVVYKRGSSRDDDRLAIKKNKQNENKDKFNLALSQTLSYFSI
jgi:hypothetical protein